MGLGIRESRGVLGSRGSWYLPGLGLAGFLGTQESGDLRGFGGPGFSEDIGGLGDPEVLPGTRGLGISRGSGDSRVQGFWGLLGSGYMSPGTLCLQGFGCNPQVFEVPKMS